MIVFAACLVASMSTCEEHRIAFDTGTPQIMCLWYAQAELARWQGEHPGWTVTRWKCEGN